MPQDRGDLEKRLAAATPKDVVKGSLINGVCATIERLAPDDPRQRELVKRYRKPLWMEFTDHPVAEFLNVASEAADLVEARYGTPAKSLQAIGAGAARAFLESVVGRLAVRMVSGKQPIDILSYGPAVYAPTTSYGKRWFTRVSDREGIFHARQEFMPPDYHLGVLPTGVQINHHAVKIEAKVLNLLDADYVVTWDGGLPTPPAKK
jgi:uncharacterized protein (TIGR02265 family)